MRNKQLENLLAQMGLTLTQSEIDDIEHAALAGSWIEKGKGNPENFRKIEAFTKRATGKTIVRVTFWRSAFRNAENGQLIDQYITHWRPIVWPEEGGKA